MGRRPSLVRSQRQAVAYLRRKQDREGGFGGLASPSEQDFSRVRHHPTIFFTALALSCLHGVSGTAVMQRRAAAFLLRHKSPQWSWNYWMRGGSRAQNRPYPDDLDDTACALAALAQYDPSLIDGAVLAHVAKQLIATEVAVGGPYATWLVEPDAPAIWRDVDIAVNANIGFLLSLRGVRLPGLEDYVAAAIQQGELTSPYYVGTVPVMYFLARWYRGPHTDSLRRLVGAQLRTAHLSSLHQALLTTAALNMGLKKSVVAAAVEQLILSQTDGSWPAAALYFEPPVRGVVHYAGSKALTTAFCLEALTAYQRAERRPGNATAAAKPVQQAVIKQVLARCDDLQRSDLRRLYRVQINRLVAGDRDHQITGAAITIAMACRAAVDSQTLLHLNAASINGWLAYTIYDDFLDEEGQPPLLGVANVALRQTVASFRAALPSHPAFQRLVDRTLEVVDGANTWEIVRARAIVRRGTLRLTAMPNYGDCAQLAERSWGHMLAATGVFVALGYSLESAEVQQLHRFFRHFLIARQLNDDAHDWEGDLMAGRITAVVALLLRGAHSGRLKIVVRQELADLRQRFWEHTIVEVAALVRLHLKSARVALQQCDALRDTAQMESWLDAIERSTGQAMAGRAEAQKFITTYTDE